jgi:hypothetical protein
MLTSGKALSYLLAVLFREKSLVLNEVVLMKDCHLKLSVNYFRFTLS